MSTCPITWRIPQGFSAVKDHNIIARAKHYRFELTHFLKDGTRIIPNVGTVNSVLQAFDTFGSDIPLVICEGSYYVPTESQLEDIEEHN
tara:strand:- start:1604 stop:1870 length:267 start_codon:yes stop_codon:yes gene_type:complete